MLSLKKKRVISAAMAVLLPVYGGNLLKNADLTEQTEAKLPRFWKIRGDLKVFSSGNGGMTLGGEKGSIMVIQRALPLKKDVPYTFRYHAVGNAKYRCYVEYSRIDDGKQRLKSFHSKWCQAVPEGKSEKFSFTIPHDLKEAYVVFMVDSEEKVTFSQLSLDEDSPEAVQEMLPNADFSEIGKNGFPVSWQCRGQKEKFRFSGSEATLEGKGAFLIAKLRNAAGTRAVLEYSVSGKGKYRVYVEWYWQDSGKKRSGSKGTAWAEATGDKERRKLEFAVPVHAESCILVFNLGDEGPVSFSDIQMTPVKSEGDFSLDAQQRKTIPLPKLIAGKKYRYRYQVRGTGPTGNTTSFHFFQVKLHDGKGKTEEFPKEDTLDGFQNKLIDFTASGDSAELTIESLSAGTLFFRNGSLELLPEPVQQERLILISPAFRDTFHPSTGEQTLEGIVSSVRPPVKSEAVLTATDGETFTAPLTKEGENWRFSLPGKAGNLTVTLYFGDNEKAVLTKTICRASASAVAVIPGPGRKLFVNGKPFLPIISWSPVGSFYALARNGINSVIVRAVSSEDLLKKLDEAQKYDLKLFVTFMGRTPATGDENAIRKWVHDTDHLLSREVLAHPALLGYFLEDEPCWNGRPVKVLQECYAALRKIDPYRPVWINAAPRRTVEQQRPYSDCCDIFGVDIYPVPQPNDHSHLSDKTMSCVGKYVHWSGRITSERKPIVMTLQGFSWKDYRNQRSREGYPTLEQCRFMAYDALINGADGLSWWGLHNVRRPAFFADLLQVTRELHSLSGALLSPNRVPGNVSATEVEYRCYSGADWSLVVAANTSEKEADAVFTDVPGIEGVQHFAPYEVKLFKAGTLPAPAWNIPPSESGKDDLLPFTEPIARFDSAVPYDAPAGMKWIWGEKESRIANSRIFAKTEFTVKENLKSASLRFTADDVVAGIRIDGESAGDPDTFMKDYRYLENLDLTKILKPGDHTVIFEVKDIGRLPCGLLAELRLDYQDGSSDSFFTCRKWQTTPSPSGPWSPALELKNPGEPPWGTPWLLKAQ